MRIEAVIGLADQLAIKSPFTDARFVACNEQNSGALRVECKYNPPLTIQRAESKLLHVRMTGALQCVHARASQRWSELLKKPGKRQNFRLHVFFQREKLRFELVADLDNPFHGLIMLLS